MNAELIQFVEHAREKGMDHATVRQLLLSAGWKDIAISQAFCTRDLDLPIPVPPGVGLARAPTPRRPGVPRKARDAFLHLLTYGTLYVWATSVVLLLFTYLDFAFPDPAWRTSYNTLQALLSIMRVQLAIVIVAFPIFLIVWNYLLREVRRNPETGKGVLRRWLGNLSLFIGAITLTGDAMTLIYFWLEGQMTIRFVLKAAVLFLIAGGLVGYLSLTLRGEATSETKTETNQ
jgi:hypothetical protein